MINAFSFSKSASTIVLPWVPRWVPAKFVSTASIVVRGCLRSSPQRGTLSDWNFFRTTRCRRTVSRRGSSPTRMSVPPTTEAASTIAGTPSAPTIVLVNKVRLGSLHLHICDLPIRSLFFLKDLFFMTTATTAKREAASTKLAILLATSAARTTLSTTRPRRIACGSSRPLLGTGSSWWEQRSYGRNDFFSTKRTIFPCKVFNEFEMEPHQECAYDHVVIYDGHTTEGHVCIHELINLLPRTKASCSPRSLVAFAAASFPTPSWPQTTRCCWCLSRTLLCREKASQRSTWLVRSRT